jgi:hypothetical protein
MSPPPTGDGGKRLSVHQLLQQTAPAYRQRFDASLPARQREVLQRLLRCRTPALGGQLFACPDCRHFHYRYHSCNDRHCPQCGQSDADAWLRQQRQRLLLPVTYFLVTFTVPEELRALLRSHPRIGLNQLFAASARSLQDLAGNPRRLGAQLGMLGVLHTWSRTLIHHPHVHYLIPGGGLSPDQRRWVPARKDYLLHHQALADRCRTLFQAGLAKEHPNLFAQVPAKVWKRRWNVGCQAVGSGENALRYLARYVFKTATGNRQLTQLPDGRIRWPYRDSRTGQETAILLEPEEWLRRFLQHVLPVGFARVRTFGWLHPAAKVRLNRVRALLGQGPVLTAEEQQTWQPTEELPADEPSTAESTTPTPATDPTAPRCPRCQRPMQLVGQWGRGEVMCFPNRPP